VYPEQAKSINKNQLQNKKYKKDTKIEGSTCTTDKQKAAEDNEKLIRKIIRVKIIHDGDHNELRPSNEPAGHRLRHQAKATQRQEVSPSPSPKFQNPDPFQSQDTDTDTDSVINAPRGAECLCSSGFCWLLCYY